MIRAVCDTGPLLHFAQAQILDSLRHIGEVYSPPQVVAELTYLLPGWQSPEWIAIGFLDAAHAAEATTWLQAELLHAGEAEAIALARQIEADWLLTDDTAARLFASELGLEVHGSLGIVLWAAAVGIFARPAAEKALTQLAASSLWLSGKILGEAWAALEEIYRAESG
jgi:predicted nucleic acid-binding protein